MLASIIISTLNREQEINELLFHFLNNENYRPFEIIVIDQSSKINANISKIKKRFSLKKIHLAYLIKKFKNQYAAINYGVKLSQGEIVVFIDDDVKPKSGFLKSHILPYSNPQIIAVTGPILNPGQSLVSRNSFSKEKYEKIIDERKLARNAGFIHFPKWAPGGNLSFRKEFFKSIGGYNENFYGGVAVGSDSEIWVRAKKAGGLLYYSPRAALIHKSTPYGGCRDIASEKERSFKIAYNRNYLFYKWGEGNSYKRYKGMGEVFRRLILNKKAIAKGPLYLITNSFEFFKGILKCNFDHIYKKSKQIKYPKF